MLEIGYHNQVLPCIGLAADFFQLSAANERGVPDSIDSLLSVLLLDWGGYVARFPEEKHLAFFTIMGIGFLTVAGLGVLAGMFAFKKNYRVVIEVVASFLSIISGEV